MNFEEAMAQVDDGRSVDREGWRPEENYWPNGASAWYSVSTVGGRRTLCLSTVALGEYRPTEADLVATDWEAY